MARKFLYLVAILIVLGLSGLLAFRLFGVQMMRAALVPGVAFEAQPPIAADRYRDKAMWIARPDIPGNAALWTPVGASPARTRADVAIFYVHPTSYFDRAAWNAPLKDSDADARAELFLRGQVTAFNNTGEIWAPRYRQATFGAFLTTQPDRHRALDFAYGDVAAAFDEFLREIGPARPFMLVGHSQGSLHLARLLTERIAGTALQRRIVAAYIVGWPISRANDLPKMGLPECRGPTQTGCILSWQSFAEPAEPAMITDVYDATIGFNGQPRRGTAMICTNPLTGTPDGAAPARANLGTLLPSADLHNATLIAGRVPARCDHDFLLIGGAPEGINNFVLPGNNYHVFDYSLFWGNVRADAARRAAAFGTR